MCTAPMANLGKFKYNNKEILYKYKGTVDIPALEMVDDIFDKQTIGVNAVMSNAVVNSFKEHKKLTLSKTKCHRLHCGKKNPSCPELKVRDKKIHDSNEEKCLGDYISINAKHARTISKRRARGFGIISDITIILKNIEEKQEKG